MEVQTLENPSSEDPNEEEIQKLEHEVKDMAQRILHFRKTLPDLFKKTLESHLTAQRPLLSENLNGGASEHVESSRDVLLTEEDPKTVEKIQLLKLKTSSIVSVMPAVLKRMSDSIAAIDRLDNCNGNIHPAFKRKRTH
ncbi:uncharacterized protein LOC143859209 [Tasmannia lanceolata]|uniref:uncharacterized protein LOC143859209 n=1 Tax=Tasmannia lanceolata TaxID=3420 RepID=UPI0040634EBC